MQNGNFIFDNKNIQGIAKLHCIVRELVQLLGFKNFWTPTATLIKIMSRFIEVATCFIRLLMAIGCSKVVTEKTDREILARHKKVVNNIILEVYWFFI